MPKYRKFETYLVESLKNPKEAKAFLDASIRDYEEDHDTEALMLALRYLAEARGGIAVISKKSNLNRQNLYKVLTGKTIPRFDTTLAIIAALGFRFSAEAVSGR